MDPINVTNCRPISSSDVREFIRIRRELDREEKYQLDVIRAVEKRIKDIRNRIEKIDDKLLGKLGGATRHTTHRALEVLVHDRTAAYVLAFDPGQRIRIREVAPLALSPECDRP